MRTELNVSFNSPTWLEICLSMLAKAVFCDSAERGTGLMILFVIATGWFALNVFGLTAALPNDGCVPKRG